MPEGAAAGPQQAGAAARAAFGPDRLGDWLGAWRRLGGAGYGASVPLAYARASPACAAHVGAAPAIALAGHVSAVAIRAGTLAAERLCHAAPAAAARLATAQGFAAWAALMERFAAAAPESAVAVFDRTAMLLDRLGPEGLETWLLAGRRLAGTDAARRLAFFSLQDPEAEHLLERAAGGATFFDAERRMKAYLGALFAVRMPIRPLGAGGIDPARRRPGFAEGMIRMPATMPGFRGAAAEALWRAALAHIGAHVRFGPGPRPVGRLRPVQIAVVSLIEDAWVEALAMRRLPGLRRLWLGFHTVPATRARIAANLFARLSRALIDPEFEDPDSWVQKGRAMFRAGEADWEDPALADRIGARLANDLGQMRVQFNARDHSVEPPYRDDNAGLWETPDATPPDAERAEIAVESLSVLRREDRPPDDARPRRPQTGEAPPQPARPRDADARDAGIAVARYPEYDRLAACERADWTTVVEYPPRMGSARFVEETRERHGDLLARIAAVIRAARVGRAERMRRQAEGETLDLDACIDAVAALRAGRMPEARVYQTMARRRRDLTVSLLLDVSESTGDAVAGSGLRVLDLEREAAVLLAHAMAGLGDPFAVAAFCSDGREDVRLTPVKRFDQPFDARAGAALAGLTPGYSTRLGAALRHAGAGLARRASHRRLVLVVTDGEPSDIDIADPEYLVEDARRAVSSLAAQGIDAFCVALGARNGKTLARIFGRRGHIRLARIAALPERLPALYLRLTH